MSASIFCGAVTKDSNKRAKKARTDSRICFEIILSLAERYFGIDLRCQGAVNSGLFTSLDREKMPKRASDKPKKQILKHISDNFKTDSKYNKINLAVPALYINFAARNEVDRFEQLATTVKNAKTAVLYCLHILSTIPFHLIEN